jgi:hypothetical protein
MFFEIFLIMRQNVVGKETKTPRALSAGNAAAKKKPSFLG